MLSNKFSMLYTRALLQKHSYVAILLQNIIVATIAAQMIYIREDTLFIKD